MGSTARPRYIGLREISERDILELYCIREFIISRIKEYKSKLMMLHVILMQFMVTFFLQF